MDFYFVKLCWKNIWRNMRRTLLTITAIGIGVMSLVALYNYYDGFHEQVIHNVIRYHSGHFVVGEHGYFEDNTPNKFIKDPRPVYDWIVKNDKVKVWTSRILVPGMLSSAKGSANIAITGIYPAREKLVTRFSNNIIKGTYFGGKGKKPILIGLGLARLLDADIGSKLVALTQGVDGSIGNELFYVVGIFKTDSEMDKSLAFVKAPDARQLLSLPQGAVHQIAAVLNEETDLPAVVADFRNTFPPPKATKSGVQLMTWKELQRPLMAMIALNKSANRLLMAIILFVAAMGIVNSILMSILERTREFGVMMAIGTYKTEIVKMVVLETFFLTVVGVIVGNLLGILVTLYFHKYGFDLKWLTSDRIVVQGTVIQTISYPKIVWGNSLFITMAVSVLSLVISLVPIKHVLKLKPVEALRAH